MPKSKALDVAGCGLAMLGIIPLGIWFFLLYRILVAVDATTAMWAAYWIYAPITTIVTIGSKVVDQIRNES